jgi:hypothetical protein
MYNFKIAEWVLNTFVCVDEILCDARYSKTAKGYLFPKVP